VQKQPSTALISQRSSGSLARSTNKASRSIASPFVEILFSDITESGETLDLSELVRETLPPDFHSLN
jgi:hypothetical protein